MFSHEKPKNQQAPEAAELSCSFCNKHQNEVKKLIAGPTVYICDECILECVEILAVSAEAMAESNSLSSVSSQSTGEKQSQAQTCALCGLPALFEDALAIEERGFLCPGCVGAVEAAITERNLAEKD